MHANSSATRKRVQLTPINVFTVAKFDGSAGALIGTTINRNVIVAPRIAITITIVRKFSV
jgi:hypothetical protein